jgi:hypothetical protein
MDEFSKAAAWTGTQGTIQTINKYAKTQLSGPSGKNGLGSEATGALEAPRKAIADHRGSSNKQSNFDSTLSAQTDLGEHNKDA